MTAEQLEELQRLAKLPSDSPTATMLASLARRAIAADKLIEKMDSVIESRHIIVLISEADIDELDALDAAYREASK